MITRWLAKKAENRIEEKEPKSGLAQVIKTVEAQAASGESGAILVTRGGHVTRVDPEQPAQDDTADQLARLAALHDRGVLTDAEFEAQKQQVVGT